MWNHKKDRIGFPNDFIEKNKKRGDSDYRCTEDGLLTVIWFDIHNPTQHTTVNRKNKDGTTGNLISMPGDHLLVISEGT